MYLGLSALAALRLAVPLRAHEHSALATDRSSGIVTRAARESALAPAPLGGRGVRAKAAARAKARAAASEAEGDVWPFCMAIVQRGRPRHTSERFWRGS